MHPKKSDIVKKLENLELGQKSKIKLATWRLRRLLRDTIVGHDVLDTKSPGKKITRKIRTTYQRADNLMSKHLPGLVDKTPKKVALMQINDSLVEFNYTVVDHNWDKPWGGFFRLQDDDIEQFLADFFPNLTLSEAMLGHSGVELSPKILLVAPGQRLSWQFHDRRAEVWRFLTAGSYYKSNTDEMKYPLNAPAGTIVQFQQGERHRLCASADDYTVVAEIWQHTDHAQPSNENDIVRLLDDYNRS